MTVNQKHVQEELTYKLTDLHQCHSLNSEKLNVINIIMVLTNSLLETQMFLMFKLNFVHTLLPEKV